MSSTTQSPSVESTEGSNVTLAGIPVPRELWEKFPVSIGTAILEASLHSAEKRIAVLNRQNAALSRVLTSLVPPGLVEAILADAEMGQ